MEAVRVPPFEVTSSARRRTRVRTAAVREAFLHSSRLKSFLMTGPPLLYEALPFLEEGTWELMPPPRVDTLNIVLEFLLEVEDVPLKERKLSQSLSHPLKRFQ